MSDPLLDKGLPSDIEGEKIILGTCIFRNEELDDLISYGTICTYELYSHTHKRLLNRMETLRRKGMPITPDTICNGLTEEDVEKLGGRPYLYKLPDYATVPGTLPYYAKLVREKARARQIIYEADRIKTDAIDGEDVENLIARALSAFEKVRNETDAERSEPFFIHAEGLRGMKPAEFIPGTHFERDGFNVIFGPSGAFKTFMAIDNAITVAQSEPVIYWAGEGRGGIPSRTESACDHRGIDPGALYFCFEPLNLLDQSSVETFITHAGRIAERIGLVVIDTWARALVGGDENSARDCGLGISNVNRIQRALGATVAPIHHSNRAERGERGSGALRGAADVMIEMTNDDGLITVSCSKVKNAAAFEPSYFRFVTHLNSGLLLPADQVAIEYTAALTAQQSKVLEALALEIFSDCGATLRQLSDITKIPDSSLFRVLSTLKQKGFIKQGAKGDPYTITEAGRNKLSYSQGTLTALSDSDSLNYSHSHSPLGVRVESGVREGIEAAVVEKEY